MQNQKYSIVNGNQAVAHVAYRTNEVFPIYPITPSSEMSELVEEWSAHQHENIFGNVPSVYEMQSEAGVAGAMHGALQTGSLTSTFTASQGLLLMMPNMYKIAGELSPNVIHVATRSVATHALSVFGDHSDVMAVRNTGYALLGSASVQEAMDFALITQAASLASRIPFVHFFDGFRTSHEVSKIEKVSDTVIGQMMDVETIQAHKDKALNPNAPVIRGTSQAPDVFFQSREAVNTYYNACPKIVQQKMNEFAQLTGRQYHIFEYVGHPQAEQVIIAMASGTETIETTIGQLNAQGEKIGLVKVRLYRPFSVEHFIKSLPETCKAIAVLDRTKEPASVGEPLYLDVTQALVQNQANGFLPKIIGGRYGLGSKEFTPTMVKSIICNLKQEVPKNNFTVGISDDVTHLSLPKAEMEVTIPFGGQALFYSIKNPKTSEQFKNLLQYVGNTEGNFVQGYEECDYRKSSSRNVAHFRVSNSPIKAPFLVSHADFVACENLQFLEKDSVLERVAFQGVVVVLSEDQPTEVWNALSGETQKTIQKKKVRFYAVNSEKLSEYIKNSGENISVLHASYLMMGNPVSNHQIFSVRREEIKRVDTSSIDQHVERELKEDEDFAQTLLGRLLSGKGDEALVSLLPVDGTYPTGTSVYNDRELAKELPSWNTDQCIQCGACSMACPSGALRIKAYDGKILDEAPSGWKSTKMLFDMEGFNLLDYTIQVNPDQCTGCHNCVDACPAKALVMNNSKPNLERKKKHWDYFSAIPEMDRDKIDVSEVGQQQLQEPLFKYPLGEDGCGQAPYLKLMSQLFGDRLLVANATGASSIFGGALPTTPWSKTKEGKGPAWSNSLFEDNAEFGLGFRLSLDQQAMKARRGLQRLSGFIGDRLIRDILNARQTTEGEINQQRNRIEQLKAVLKKVQMPKAQQLLQDVDSLVKKSVWIVGGDGWAYDIGYGGLDHVLASGKNVNILVLDNEVYSNTGGQMSKATPFGATAKYAAKGKQKQKKDLGFLAMQYDDVYVASVAIGADQEQTLQAFLEAEKHDGPSIIIAYCHSPAHGIDMKYPSKYHKAAVASGQWLLYRNDPNRKMKGQEPMQLDSARPHILVEDYLGMEKRFKTILENEPGEVAESIQYIQQTIDKRFQQYSALTYSKEPEYVGQI
ncbi:MULTISPECIES: 4Fe-4S binding protein [Flavobacteriaceae]|uniref:4Fe-4S binding protein n=1 Tax=Flavobacteriaceae TaxID=49546 RepID=UPI00234AB40B|nr:4Fe-4S binding protein [Muricauda sp. SP22]MDC6362945.1 4Fe-4S binding protein [Muricauda sp. SP22]